MPQVKFAKDYKFAENGITYTEFKAGDEALVSQSCADSAAQAGVLEIERKAVEPTANKAMPAAPKNKARKPRAKKS